MSDLEVKVRILLSQRPVLYPWLQKFWLKVLGGRNSGKYCTQSTDLCIEGVESSANTFVYCALQVLDEDLVLAHHKHVVANLKRAVHYSVPTLIMYRDPREAIPSLVLRFRPGRKEATLRYIHFYKYVLDHIDEVMLVSFEEATSDIGAVVNRMSETWEFQFPSFDSGEIEQRAKREIERWTRKHGNSEQISLPREERNRQKEAIRDRLRELDTFEKAKDIYTQLQEVRK